MLSNFMLDSTADVVGRRPAPPVAYLVVVLVFAALIFICKVKKTYFTVRDWNQSVAYTAVILDYKSKGDVIIKCATTHIHDSSRSL